MKSSPKASFRLIKKAAILSSHAENSQLPFRRRERAMLRFRQMNTLQKLSSAYAAFQNHFTQDRHLIGRDDLKARRSAAFDEWKTLAG